MAELIAILFLLWLVGCLFPSSASSHYGPSLGEVLWALVCVLLLAALFLYWNFSMVGIMLAANWLGWTHPSVMLFALFGPIAVPMLVAALCQTRRAK